MHLPSAPSSMRFFNHFHAGQNRMHIAGMQIFFTSRATASSWRISSARSETGFSTSTCFPARNATVASSTCEGVGVQMQTRSMAVSASSASADSYARTFSASNANFRWLTSLTAFPPTSQARRDAATLCDRKRRQDRGQPGLPRRIHRGNIRCADEPQTDDTDSHHRREGNAGLLVFKGTKQTRRSQSAENAEKRN